MRKIETENTNKSVITDEQATSTYNSDKQQFDDFVNSKIIFYAVVKNIEIVGEATYMLTNEFKSSHQSIPWQVIEKMRHVLVHGYYTISPEKVWETIQNDLPVLKEQLLGSISSDL